MARILAKIVCILLAFVAFCVPFYSLSPAHAALKEVFDENYFELKAESVLLSSYTTRFGGSPPERKHNIKVAAKKINKTKINPGKKFSFNLAAGARSFKNG